MIFPVVKDAVLSPKTPKHARRAMFRVFILLGFVATFSIQLTYVPVLKYFQGQPSKRTSMGTSGNSRKLLDANHEFGGPYAPKKPTVINALTKAGNSEITVFFHRESGFTYKAFVTPNINQRENEPISKDIFLESVHEDRAFFQFTDLNNYQKYKVGVCTYANNTLSDYTLDEGDGSADKPYLMPVRLPSFSEKDLLSPSQIASWGIIFYIIGVVYMFIALAIICDEFFVPALEVISEKWDLSDDVAGATLMAAGGSAPELFTSFVSTMLYTDSSLGFGTIVGSAVFNVLFVIAMCAIFTSGDLALTWWPLARDCSYYAVTLFTVAVCFGYYTPCQIDLGEALVLFGLYIGYVIYMKYNEHIRLCIVGCCGKRDGQDLESLKDSADSEEKVVNKIPPRHGLSVNEHQHPSDVGEQRGSIIGNRIRAASTHLNPDAPKKRFPSHFRAGVWSIMKDPTNMADHAKIMAIARIEGDVYETFATLDKDNSNTISRSEIAALVKSANGETKDAEIDVLMKELDEDNDGLITIDEFKRWYMKSQDRLQIEAKDYFSMLDKGTGKISIMEFRHLLTMIEPQGNEPPAEAYILAVFKTLDTENENKISWDQFQKWYLTSDMFKEKMHQAEEAAEEDEPGVSLDFPDGCQARLVFLINAPLIYFMYYTIPNAQEEKWRNWCYFAFFMSIVHIMIYSYLMVWFATIIGDVFMIPEKIMGLTLLAAGTSVPDLLSSVVVAKQGKGDMAVSSSIGSNIFDVCVGLPLPWILYCLVYEKAYKVVPDDVSIFILLGMIVFVILIIMASGWKLNKCLAVCMFLLYVTYVGVDIFRTTNSTGLDSRCPIPL